jgi:ABC-2 type transport system permease protein
MNTQSTSLSESSFQSQGFATTASATLRPFYWSVRRELWENRYLYIAPLAAAIVFLFGFAINTVRLRIRSEALLFPWKTPHGLRDQYDLLAALMMGTVMLVSVFYCLDALYGERRDRSILFWKSLPVSDATAVISKLSIPIFVLPLLGFAMSFVTQFLMLVMTSAIFAGSGVSIAAFWTQAPLLRVPLIWLYHLVTVHGLWYAPLYAWLLLVSAWAPRAPFMWAFLPPFVIWGVERLAFNTSYFLSLLQYRFLGPGGSMPHDNGPQDFTSTLIPHHFFNNPDLWTGLVVAMAFLFAAIRLRRSRGPI